MNKLAIITVVYQNYEVLKDFFASLQKQENKNFELFIIDNSKDKKPIGYQGVDYQVFPSDNKGFAAGVNLGLDEAQKKGFQYFCVINNDVFFEKEFVGKVLESLKKNPGAIVGGKIYYAPGYEYHHSKYEEKDRGKVIWYAGGFVDWDHALTSHRGVDEVDRGQYDSSKETGFITGALMCFDKEVVSKNGPWDESYFLYFEDTDWIERAKRRGIKLIYDPSLIIWHKVSQSTEGSGSSLHQKYQSKNQVRFALRYAPLRTKLHVVKNYLLRKLSR